MLVVALCLVKCSSTCVSATKMYEALSFCHHKDIEPYILTMASSSKWGDPTVAVPPAVPVAPV